MTTSGGLRSSGGRGGGLSHTATSGRSRPPAPFLPLPLPGEAGTRHRDCSVAAAASAPAALGYGGFRPLPGRCVLRLRGLPPKKKGVGREGGDAPGGLGRGFEVLEVTIKDGSKDEKWRKGAAIRRTWEVRKGRWRVGHWGRSTGVGEP